nr:hypothetical protein [Tanacetum cinerariifolium]
MLVVIPLPPVWKELWEAWDLRGFIILSLSLKTFLILFAPIRKRTITKWIIMPLWSAYLLADWAAKFAVGLISSCQGSPRVSSSQAIENENLLSFRAPFLLVHLGGIVKYAERTRSLYLASADRFKDSMLTDADHAPTMQNLWVNTFQRGGLNSRLELKWFPSKSCNKAEKGNLTELELIQYAYWFFQSFKGLVVDLIFSPKEQNQSRDFFLNRTAKDAFQVVKGERSSPQLLTY